MTNAERHPLRGKRGAAESAQGVRSIFGSAVLCDLFLPNIQLISKMIASIISVTCASKRGQYGNAYSKENRSLAYEALRAGNVQLIEYLNSQKTEEWQTTWFATFQVDIFTKKCLDTEIKVSRNNEEEYIPVQEFLRLAADWRICEAHYKEGNYMPSPDIIFNEISFSE